jgi:hypothetical protein
MATVRSAPGPIVEPRCTRGAEKSTTRIPDSRDDHGCSQEEDLKGQEPLTPGLQLDPEARCPQRLPSLQRVEAPARGVRELWLVRRPSGDRRRLIAVRHAVATITELWASGR